MKRAKVEFLTMDMDPVKPGETPMLFCFDCPKRPGRRCGGLLIADAGHGIKWDPQNQNSGRAQWRWDGNRDAPTFTPSINCPGCWHGYIRGGRCVNSAGQDEP